MRTVMYFANLLELNISCINVQIFDATNTTRERRALIMEFCSSRGFKVNDQKEDGLLFATCFYSQLFSNFVKSAYVSAFVCSLVLYFIYLYCSFYMQYIILIWRFLYACRRCIYKIPINCKVFWTFHSQVQSCSFIVTEIILIF